MNLSLATAVMSRSEISNHDTLTVSAPCRRRLLGPAHCAWVAISLILVLLTGARLLLSRSPLLPAHQWTSSRTGRRARLLLNE